MAQQQRRHVYLPLTNLSHTEPRPSLNAIAKSFHTVHPNGIRYTKCIFELIMHFAEDTDRGKLCYNSFFVADADTVVGSL